MKENLLGDKAIRVKRLKKQPHLGGFLKVLQITPLLNKDLKHHNLVLKEAELLEPSNNSNKTEATTPCFNNSEKRLLQEELEVY